MAPSRALTRPLAFFRSPLWHARQQQRCISTREAARNGANGGEPVALNFPPARGYSRTLPPPRVKPVHKHIPIHPPPPSPFKRCPNPIQTLTAAQLTTLDPTGARSRLFAKSNPDGAKVGDTLLVRLRNGDGPFAGVCMSIRRGKPGHGVKRGFVGRARDGGSAAIEEKGGLGVDTAVLLRNTVTRVGVEAWFKVFSPLVVGVEVVQKATRRIRRARLYYLRKPKHDPGNVDNVVRQYLRKSTLLSSKGSKGAGPGSKKGKRKN